MGGVVVVTAVVHGCIGHDGVSGWGALHCYSCHSCVLEGCAEIGGAWRR